MKTFGKCADSPWFNSRSYFLYNNKAIAEEIRTLLEKNNIGVILDSDNFDVAMKPARTNCPEKLKNRMQQIRQEAQEMMIANGSIPMLVLLKIPFSF